MNIAKIKEQVLASLKEVSSDPEMHIRFFEFMSRFHHYSFMNQILIFLQRPDAIQVAGFYTWRKLGRTVRKGEKGIAIIRPVFPKLTKSEASDDDEPDKELRAPSYYTTCHVFDYAQTNGQPIEVPPIGRLITPQVDETYDSLKQLAQDLGRSVAESAMRFAIGGTASKDRIRINTLHPKEAQCQTMVHEIAHVVLGHTDGRMNVTREQKETEAELCSFLVSMGLGIPKGHFEYIQSWNPGEISDEVFEQAFKAAHTINDRLHGGRHEKTA